MCRNASSGGCGLRKWRCCGQWLCVCGCQKIYCSHKSLIFLFLLSLSRHEVTSGFFIISCSAPNMLFMCSCTWPIVASHSSCLYMEPFKFLNNPKANAKQFSHLPHIFRTTNLATHLKTTPAFIGCEHWLCYKHSQHMPFCVKLWLLLLDAPSDLDGSTPPNVRLHQTRAATTFSFENPWRCWDICDFAPCRNEWQNVVNSKWAFRFIETTIERRSINQSINR